MATFVLLAGAWHGAWCWKRARALLLQAGHTVIAPTYTGVGERVHLAGPDIGLATHILDVVLAMEYEDVTDAILVGHSYGGVVMTGVADRVPERVRRRVYFDTSIPRDGDSVSTLMSASSQALIRANTDPDGWRVWPTSVDRLGIDDPADRAWVAARLTPHPLRGFTDRLALTDAIADIPGAYILCQRDPTAPL
ncbi:MAG: alpha/beta hydrolase, partial [Dehalococcoidia bacterium]|nr:alpha/beta hydrolase [Dehalococcoidia bacterium]